MTWWQEFFDDEYVFLYSKALTAERTEQEVRGVTALLRLGAGARVLDLCCGDGRHAVPLQRRGFRVTGVDSSPRLLLAARRRGEAVSAVPTLIRGDAREVPLRERSADAAICLFNSLGYGTDADTLAMLRECRRVAPALVVEIAHRDEHVRRARPGVEREWMDVDGRRVHTERTLDPVAGVARAVFSFDGKVRELRHRLYTATELVTLLRAAGFAQVDCYGSYERAPFSIDAPLLVAHAKAA